MTDTSNNAQRVAENVAVHRQAEMLAEVWANLPVEEQIDQIELHLECEGYSAMEIDIALDALELL